MRTIRKRHSWPPLRVSRAVYLKENIDSDPFAYFISPASDRDFVSDLSAGIDTSNRSRSLSPKTHKRHAVISTAFTTSSPTAKLKRWIERMELRCFPWSPKRSERPTLSPDPPRSLERITPISRPVRGRNNIRSGSVNRVSPNQRSLPRKPRAWREPSESIWSVAEEGEEIGLGITM